MRSSRLSILAAGFAASLVAALLLPVEAWSQFRSRTFSSPFNTSTTTAAPTVTSAPTTSSSDTTTSSTAAASTETATAVALVAISATSGTIAGPGNFTDDRANPEQNVIYEVFGAASVNACLTIQNRGRLGDVQTIVDGFEVGDRIKPARTRTRCFETPQSIELRCTSSLCDALWRIDAV